MIGKHKPHPKFLVPACIIAVLLFTILACITGEPILQTEHQLMSSVEAESALATIAGMPDLLLPAGGIMHMGEPEDPTIGWVVEGECRHEWRVFVFISERMFTYSKQFICENSVGDGTREYWDTKTQEHPEIRNFPITSKGFLSAPILYQRDVFAHPSSNNSSSFSEQLLVGRVSNHGQEIWMTICLPSGYDISDVNNEAEIKEILDDDRACKNSISRILQPYP
jgi:hypothetical protein